MNGVAIVRPLRRDKGHSSDIISFSFVLLSVVSKHCEKIDPKFPDDRFSESFLEENPEIVKDLEA